MTKILIVDDEPHMRRIIEMSLRKGGFTIITGQNGQDAVELATREKPSVIVMDLQMPVVDGLTALKQLKAAEPTASIPVIMLTVGSQALPRKQAESFGAALYLTKPFSPSQLLAQVQSLLALPGVAAADANS